MKSGEDWSSGFREEDIYIFQGFIPVYSTGARTDNPRRCVCVLGAGGGGGGWDVKF